MLSIQRRSSVGAGGACNLTVRSKDGPAASGRQLSSHASRLLKFSCRSRVGGSLKNQPRNESTSYWIRCLREKDTKTTRAAFVNDLLEPQTMEPPVAFSNWPECGGSVVSKVDGSSLVLHCTVCSWEVATTNQHHPAFDRTAYSVFVSAPTLERGRLIAVLAAELGLGIAEARRLVDNGDPIASKANASEVYRLDKTLRPLGIMLCTEPSFPWPLT